MKAFILFLLLSSWCASAQLAVSVSPVKVTGQKAVVPLALKNNFDVPIESARAACFLLDEHGKMVGQSTKWVVSGGPGKPGLAASATNSFHFVIASDKLFATTNLTAKVVFSRVVLEDGKLADPNREVRIQPAAH